MSIAHALRRTAAVGEDEIGYPAVLAKVQFLHVTQPGDAVHYRVAGFLIANYGLNELIFGLFIEFEVLRSFEGCMEIKRYRGDMRIIAHVVQRRYEAVLIERIEHHVHAYILTSGLSDMFLESSESWSRRAIDRVRRPRSPQSGYRGCSNSAALPLSVGVSWSGD